MKDPESVDDTEPIGAPVPAAHDTDPQGDSMPTTDVLLDGLGEGAGEQDTDEFLRWLPTMSLEHRRRKELVQRPSSDGADFAAYAGEGRPATASTRAPARAAVHVEAASERDAPTVLRQKPARGPRRLAMGGVAVAVVALSIAVAAGAYGPLGKTQRSAAPAALSLPPRLDQAPEAKRESVPAPSAAGSLSEAEVSNASATTATETPRAAANAGRPAGLDASKARAAHASAPHAALPAKDQYFEVP